MFKSNNVDDLAKKLKLALKPEIADKEVEHNDRNIRKFSIENTTAMLWKLYKEQMNA